MSVSAEQRSNDPPVAFTDAAVIDAFRRIPDDLARDQVLMTSRRMCSLHQGRRIHSHAKLAVTCHRLEIAMLAQVEEHILVE